MNQFEKKLNRLRILAKQEQVDAEELNALRSDCVAVDYELANVLFALLANRGSLPSTPIELPLLKSGACPLFQKGSYLWRALPYLRDHAELGKALYLLGKESNQPELIKQAERIKRWQINCTDHRAEPIYSLFNQENGVASTAITEANHDFFASVCTDDSQDPLFVDHELALVIQRQVDATIMCVGSGCKSGMGAFLRAEGGIVNYGPQIMPLGDCRGFGLASEAKDFTYTPSEEGWALSYCSAVAAHHPRKTALSYLRDARASGLWLDCKATYKNQKIHNRIKFKGIVPIEKVLFTFFAKASCSLIAGSHKLAPNSLDRYKGPCQMVEFCNEQGNVCLDFESQDMQMEVIPLAGDNSFWQSNFLVALSLTQPEFAFSLL